MKDLFEASLRGRMLTFISEFLIGRKHSVSMDYGSIIYGSAHKSYIKALDAIHHQGLRIATGAFRTSPVESLYVEADEESLYRWRKRLSLLHTIKLRSTPTNPVLDTDFKPNCTKSLLQDLRQSQPLESECSL